MKSFDYDAVTYDGDIYCVECLPAEISVDSEEVRPCFASDEFDFTPVCCNCGTEHDYMAVIGSPENFYADAR